MEAVFGTGFIEVSEIHTHSPFSVRFLYQDYVGQQVRVVYLLDKLCLQELLDLCCYSLDSFRCELPSLLLHRLHVRVHIQNVDNLFRLIPGMSACDQANTSIFLQRKSTRPSWISCVRQVPICKTFPFPTTTSSSGFAGSPLASNTGATVRVVESETFFMEML
jgi:hypothetical protein